MVYYGVANPIYITASAVAGYVVRKLGVFFG
jgi:hypothetical protein